MMNDSFAWMLFIVAEFLIDARRESTAGAANFSPNQSFSWIPTN